MKNQAVIIAAVALLIGGGLGFFWGMKYQSVNRSGFRENGNFQGRGTGGNTQNRTARFGGVRPVIGEILSLDDRSITVKLLDGSSKIILLSTNTAYNKASEGTKSDLKKGDKVAAYGTENTDGSVTAVNIQMNPVLNITGGGNRTQNQTQNQTQP